MIEFRDYQEQIIQEGVEILEKSQLLYLSMEVRTGKTLTALGICEKLDVDDVLFITKKKAISTITADSDKLCPSYSLFVINYESLHKLPNIRWDVIICDEAHSIGAFPKPSNRAKAVRDLIQRNDPRLILMSGTPTPESFSQMYHQVYAAFNNPFKKYKNFYRFADDYVNVKQLKISGRLMNDYKTGKQEILTAMKPHTISYSQKEAGFVSKIEEEVLTVKMSDHTYNLANRLRRDLVVEGKEEVLLADTPVKLMMKLHQIYSGTVKFESGKAMTLDRTKGDLIKAYFTGRKIGIFYKFKQELAVLKEVFGDELTTELSVFEDTDKNIALQIVSGREGISLRQADCLVYMNIDFSATSYWQSRDRMTTKDRVKNGHLLGFQRGRH